MGRNFGILPAFITKHPDAELVSWQRGAFYEKASLVNSLCPFASSAELSERVSVSRRLLSAL